MVVTAIAVPNRPAKLVGRDDAGDDHQSRQRRRFQRHREALDDVGAMAGDRSLGDGHHRTLARAGIIFGDVDDGAGHREADEADRNRPKPVTRLAGDHADRAPADGHRGRHDRPTTDSPPVAIRPL